MPSVYEIITGKIIERLEAGTIPWERPWNGSAGAPRNIRGTFYKGINVFLLGCQAYSSPFWMTYKQAQERGGSVRKGQKGSPVIFWKWLEKEDAAGKEVRIPLLRYFTVFNAEQVEGVQIPPVENSTREHEPLQVCEEVVAGYSGSPVIHSGGGAAFYRPSDDSVTVPGAEHFKTSEGYYSTLFHELGHSTGHRSRLARDGVVNGARFASHEYSAEELVAEMTAAFLCGRCGIDRTLDNSAAYLASWLKVLRKDARMVVVAAAQAQKAADWIAGANAAEEALAA